MIFAGQDKITAIEEINVLNSKKIGNSRAQEIIRNLLIVIAKGTSFNPSEATNAFFAVTKLFQFSDPLIIRLCHLIIYEMTQFTSDTLIATSSLIKNVNTNNNFYKSSAIKVLMAITDDKMIGGIERYIKQAIVFNDSRVASAAIVSAYKLKNYDNARRWLSEIGQALESRDPTLQYQSFALMFQLKKDDKLAMLKLFTKYHNIINSPLGKVFMIRTALYQIKSQNISPSVTTNSNDNIYFDYLSQCLQSRNGIVLAEICRTICYLDKLSSKICLQLISAFKAQLNNPKAAIRLSAIRSLYELINRHEYLIPEIIKSNISTQLESLTNDCNRNVIMYAVVITLKLATGKNISKSLDLTMEFISELPDELKIKIIFQLKYLILKYPNQSEILTFLTKVLKESGSHDFKSALIDVLLVLVKKFDKQRDHALMILCDYSEDCEYPSLLIKALYYIGKYACKTPNPLRFVRPIYNRIVLENQTVRIAALHTLARISSTSQQAKEQILHIFNRFVDDDDSQVRSTVIFYKNLLSSTSSNLSSEDIYSFFIEKTNTPLKNVGNPLLEDELKAYLEKSEFSVPFDFSKVEMILKTESSISDGGKDSKDNLHAVDLFGGNTLNSKSNDNKALSKDSGSTNNIGSEASSDKSTQTDAKNLHIEALFKDLTQFEKFDLGRPILISSKPTSLSESDSEYIVTCYKYLFSDNRLLIQFVVKNTVPDVTLKNVSVSIESTIHTEIMHTVSCLEIDSDSQAYTYSLLKFNSEDQIDDLGFCDIFLATELQCVLTFEVFDKLAHSSFPDEYQLEALEFCLPDLVVESKPSKSFESEWNSLTESNELQMKFVFNCFKTIEDATREIITSMGVKLLDQKSVMSVQSSKDNLQHSLCSAFGIFMNKYNVAVILDIKFQTKNQLTTLLDVRVRSPDAQVSELLLSPFSE